jgi:hypothetical protein
LLLFSVASKMSDAKICFVSDAFWLDPGGRPYIH